MSAHSIASRSTTALFWSVGGAIGKIAGQLIVQITLARILDPVAFGQYAAMLVIFGLGNTLADGGFGSALIQKKQIDDSDVGLALGWSMLFAGLAAAAIFVFAPLLAEQFGDAALIPVFKVCAVLLPFQIALNLSNSLLRRDLHMKGMQVIGLISYIVFFGGVATVLAMLGYGVWSLVGGFAAQTVFALVATYWISRHTLRPRLRGDRSLLHFGFKALGIELGTWSMDTLDRFLIGKFWGLYSLGLYSVAYNLSKAPTGLLVWAAQSIAFASSSRLQGEQESMRKGFLLVLTAMALTTLPLFALVAIEAQTVLHIVYGLKWIAAAPYMTALACTIPLASLGAITAAILRGSGVVGVELRIQIISGMTLFASFMVLRDTSLTLAVWAVPFAYLVRLLLLLAAIRERLNLRATEIGMALRGAVMLAGVAAVAATLAQGLPTTPVFGITFVPLLVGLVTILAAFVVCFRWVLGPSLADFSCNKLANSPIGPALAWLNRRKA